MKHCTSQVKCVLVRAAPAKHLHAMAVYPLTHELFCSSQAMASVW